MPLRIPSAILWWCSTTRVVAASRSFHSIFRLVRGSLLYEIDGGRSDTPEFRKLLGAISSGQAPIEGYEVDREFPATGQRVMFNARKLSYEKGTPMKARDAEAASNKTDFVPDKVH